MAQDDPFGQMPSDRTLIIPSPGARAAAAAQPGYVQPPPSGGRFDRVELNALDWDTGLNPLVAATQKAYEEQRAAWLSPAAARSRRRLAPTCASTGTSPASASG